MKLAVIIVNYNTKQYLQKCLESLMESDYPLKDLSIVVVDNASVDNTIEDLRYKFQNVSWIKLDENVGFSRANNLGIRKWNQADYYLFLNPDTQVSLDGLSKMLKYMDNNLDVSILSPYVKLPDGSIDDACHRGFPTPWNAVCHFSGLSKFFPNSLLFNGYHLGYRNLNKVHEIDACAGAVMLVRRRAGENIGWWDEDYFWYGEDLDFCYRVKFFGGKILFYPGVEILHHKGVSGGIKKKSSNYSNVDSLTKKRAQKARFDAMIIFYKKHYADKYPKILTLIVTSFIRIIKVIKAGI